jgi:hypothetical protein
MEALSLMNDSDPRNQRSVETTGKWPPVGFNNLAPFSGTVGVDELLSAMNRVGGDNFADHKHRPAMKTWQLPIDHRTQLSASLRTIMIPSFARSQTPDRDGPCFTE